MDSSAQEQWLEKGSSEHSNAPLRSITGGKFLHYLRIGLVSTGLRCKEYIGLHYLNFIVST